MFSIRKFLGGFKVLVFIWVAVGLIGSSSVLAVERPMDNKKDDILKIVGAVEPANMNPVKQANSFGTYWQPVVEPLIRTDLKFRPIKTGLVTDWKRISPGTWQFTLQKGVTFTNGEPWDSSAMAFTLNTYRDTVGAPMRAYLGKIKTSVVSPTVLDVVSSQPDSSIPFVMTAIRALPPVHYAKLGHDGFGQNPIGTGPYKFESWTKGVDLRLVRNEKYWDKKAGIKRLSFRFASDPNTRANLLRSGAVDFAILLPLQRIESIQKSAKNNVVLREDTGQIALFYLGQKTELKDLELRKAATLALDIEAITSKVLLSKGGIASCALLTPLLKNSEKPKCHEQDLKTAKAITAKYGNPTITFNYGPARGPSDEAVAQAVAGQLRKAGFTVKMAPDEYSKLTTNLVLGRVDGLVMFSIVPVFPHPSVYAQGFLTPTSITKNCLAPGMAELSAKALEASAAESSKIYLQMEKIAITEYYCMLPMYQVINNWGMSKSLGGFDAPPAVVINWAAMYWK